MPSFTRGGIRRQGGGSKKKSSSKVGYFVCAILFFCMGMMMGMLLPSATKQHSSSASSAQLSEFAAQKDSKSPKGNSEEKNDAHEERFVPEALFAPGWHPIHVYYGDRNELLKSIPEVERDKKTHQVKEWFGQHGQDVAVAKLLNYKRNGFFVDLAANDAVMASNTFTLETKYGWNGICIEPNPHYWYYLSFRKCHVLGAMVGKTNGEEVVATFEKGPFGGIVGKGFDNRRRKQQSDVTRYTASLESILKYFGAPEVIDYISLDVEGAEEYIMSSFPFELYKFRALTIERPKDQLKELLESNGYRHVSDFGGGDTLWEHAGLKDQEDVAQS